MPVLRLIRERFERERPLAGLRIGACLHVTTETANLMRTLKAGGAEVTLRRIEPALDEGRRRRRARRRVRDRPLRPPRRGPRHVLRATSTRSPTRIPQITMDDGCDLVSLLHAERPDQLGRGPRRDRGDDDRRHPAQGDGRRRRPAASRSWPSTRPRPSTSSTTATAPASPPLDGILRATNILIAGRHVVVAGYGWVGKGIASRMAGHGRPRRGRRGRPGPRARGAHGRLRGHDRRPRRRRGASCSSPPPATSTSSGASTSRRCATARSWPTAATSTPSWTSPALRELAEGHVREVRDNVQEFDLGGKKLNLIAEGRLVNLGAAEGHPAAVMDMSFANQALSRRVRRAPPRRARGAGLRRAGGDRRRGRPAQAGRARHRRSSR